MQMQNEDVMLRSWCTPAVKVCCWHRLEVGLTDLQRCRRCGRMIPFWDQPRLSADPRASTEYLQPSMPLRLLSRGNMLEPAESLLYDRFIGLSESLWLQAQKQVLLNSMVTIATWVCFVTWLWTFVTQSYLDSSGTRFTFSVEAWLEYFGNPSFLAWLLCNALCRSYKQQELSNKNLK